METIQEIPAAREPSARAIFETGRPEHHPYKQPSKVRPDWSQKPGVLQVDGAAEINAEHQLAIESASGAVTHAIKCGELLIEQKSRLKHGEFGAWIAKHCKFSQATANNYMRAAQNPSAVSNSLRHLYSSGRKVATVKVAAPTDTAAAASRAVNITQARSCSTPDSIMEDERGRYERRLSIDQVIEGLLSSAEVKCKFMWRYAEPHIGAIEPGKAAEFKKRAAQCEEHFARLVKLLGVQP